MAKSKKASPKSKKEEDKKVRQPWFTLIMSTLACLALVVGLYYANKANMLKSKALKQEQKARRNIVPTANPIKKRKINSEHVEDIFPEEQKTRNAVPSENSIRESKKNADQDTRKYILSEEQQKKKNNIEQSTEKNTEQVTIKTKSPNKKKKDERANKMNSKSSNQTTTSARKSAKTKDSGAVKTKVEFKSTTANKTKRLTPRLVDFKRVPRLDGVKVGYERNMELEPGKMYKVITRSLRPPVFEIPNFLTGAECQQILNQVDRQVLEPSPVNDINDDGIEPTNQETFNQWDYNHDHVISPLEVMHNMIDLSDLYFSEKDITKMFKDLHVDKNGNDVIDLDEFLRVTTDRIVRYLHGLARKLDRVKGRNSKQTWADHSVITGLDERVAALTKLPVVVVAQSEKLQVVQYDPEGHYHCHHDSQPIEEEVPCCYERDKRHCRLCRYITVLYFLNDVEEGGETAFPVADNATFSIEDWTVWTKFRCDLSKHCHKANLYIPPKKGTAIMWYNHHLDPKTGWVGDLDDMTYHGGCDVTRGQKWIANNWINIMGKSRAHMITHTNPKKKI